jgi:hypothetical protein
MAWLPRAAVRRKRRGLAVREGVEGNRAGLDDWAGRLVLGLTAAISQGLARVSIEVERRREGEGERGREGENSNSALSALRRTAPLVAQCRQGCTGDGRSAGVQLKPSERAPRGKGPVGGNKNLPWAADREEAIVARLELSVLGA